MVPINSPGCIPIIGFKLVELDSGMVLPGCAGGKLEYVLNALIDNPGSVVVWGGMIERALTGEMVGLHGSMAWKRGFMPNRGDAASLRLAINDTLRLLSNFADHVLVVQIPEFGYDAQSALFLSKRGVGGWTRVLSSGRSFNFLNNFTRSQSNALFEELLNESISRVDVLEPMCKPYEGVCSPIYNGVPLYFDSIHPSAVYAQLLARVVINDLALDFDL